MQTKKQLVHSCFFVCILATLKDKKRIRLYVISLINREKFLNWDRMISNYPELYVLLYYHKGDNMVIALQVNNYFTKIV